MYCVQSCLCKTSLLLVLYHLFIYVHNVIFIARQQYCSTVVLVCIVSLVLLFGNSMLKYSMNYERVALCGAFYIRHASYRTVAQCCFL